VYVSPATAGEGLGDGLGDGDGGVPGRIWLLDAGLGDGGVTSVAAGSVGVGAAPPTQPQARMSTVPTINPWTVQRVFGRTSFLNIVREPYALRGACATVFRIFGARS
jgi:hypothetical protein